MDSAANNQKSSTYQYPTEKKVRKLFEVPMYFISRKTLTDSDLIRFHGLLMNAANQLYFSLCYPL